MRTKIVMLSIMLLIVLSPTLIKILVNDNIFPINENRNRREFPTIAEISELGFQEINEWYNDQFGLRDVLIRLQHQIDYIFFRYSKNLFFSKDNSEKYLFYRSVISQEQIANERMTIETQEAIINNLIIIKNRLETKSIDFKFCIAPQKNEILEDESSKIPVRRPKYDMYDLMQDKFINSELKDNYVNVLDVLKAANEIRPTYYYSDFHWNDWGAACAFGTIINEYAEKLGMESVYNINNMEETKFVPDINFAQLSSLSVLSYDIPTEITVNTLKELNSVRVDMEKYPDWVIWENKSNPIFKEGVLFIGDSYTPPALNDFNGTSSGIVELFPKVYFCHWDYADNILDNLPEDVGFVVLEVIESNYSYLDSKLETLY